MKMIQRKLFEAPPITMREFLNMVEDCNSKSYLYVKFDNGIAAVEGVEVNGNMIMLRVDTVGGRLE